MRTITKESAKQISSVELKQIYDHGLRGHYLKYAVIAGKELQLRKEQSVIDKGECLKTHQWNLKHSL